MSCNHEINCKLVCSLVELFMTCTVVILAKPLQANIKFRFVSDVAWWSSTLRLLSRFLPLSLSTKLGFISRVTCARTYSRSECECACFVVSLLERSNGAPLSTWTSCVLSRNRSTNCDVTTKISVDCLTPDPTLRKGRLSLDLRLFFPIFDLLSVLCLFFFSLRIFSTSVRTFLIL